MGRRSKPSPIQGFSSPVWITVLAMLILGAAPFPGQGQSLSSAAGAGWPSAGKDLSSVETPPIAPPAPQPRLIVIGFAGGFIRSTNTIHGEVRLAVHLREKYSSTIHAEVFENHHGDEAHREILRLLGASNGAGAIPASAKRAARIVLYGHSWGASEAVAVARQLERDGIPVLLLVQVDGVSKGIQDDGVIPANVAQAVNFYQSDGLLHGRSRIYAANPAKTKIIGNFRVSYKAAGDCCPGYPWFARTFTKPHIEIENDPRVWNEVEALILARAQPREGKETTTLAADGAAQH